jgi:hypothetical protein
MNDQNFAVRENTSDDTERTDQGKSDLVLEGLIQQTPMGGGMVPVGPTDEAVVEESPPDGKIPSKVPRGDVAAPPNPDESEHFRSLWNEIQGRFVDEPRSAVQHADTLVTEVIEKITQQFANEQSSLERQWKEGNDASTEDLRQALQQYRSFFNRLVARM